MFSVVKKYKDPLSRLVHEAVRIPTGASMNSKGEWGGYRIARLMVDKSELEAKRDIEAEDRVTEGEKAEMLRLKERLIRGDFASAQPSNILIDKISCRLRSKRSYEVMENEQSATPVQAPNSKKLRTSCVRTRDGGVWDPCSSRFVKNRKNATSTPVATSAKVSDGLISSVSSNVSDSQ